MGSKRPENCPVDSFQWRTGGSPGKGVTTIEIAVSAPIEVAGIPYYAEGEQHELCNNSSRAKRTSDKSVILNKRYEGSAAEGSHISKWLLTQPL